MVYTDDILIEGDCGFIGQGEQPQGTIHIKTHWTVDGSCFKCYRTEYEVIGEEKNVINSGED